MEVVPVFAANAGGYFDNMQQRFRRDVPPVEVRAVPSMVAKFLDDMFTDSGVTKPVDDLYIGTHAGGDGFLFVRLFRGQVDVRGDPTDVTDYEAYLLLRMIGGTLRIIGESHLMEDRRAGFVPDIGKELKNVKISETRLDVVGGTEESQNEIVDEKAREEAAKHLTALLIAVRE